MNTAGNFTDSMESGNDLTVSVNDLSVGIDHNTAHCVMHRHTGVTCPKRSLLNLSQIVRFLSRYLEAIQTCTLLLSSLFDEAERGDSFTTRATPEVLSETVWFNDFQPT